MLIKVKVYPQSDENVIIKKSEDSYVIKVKEKAEKGEANRRLKEILAGYFYLPPGKIRLIKGGKKPNIIFEILT
ncbi:hypothetical protein A3F57_00995 [Candidatus Roizmanbacteria bacterium RIFCSPHIGHO2_12_FULL_36_11]|nr:MAG: hypothetical protein A3F57_00995 [Candidatus Roizmanbacteria bacterium RIFCSPHIGHO2_12_FULL_36_11]